MKTCRDMAEHASVWLDGDTGAPDWDEIQTHLAVCEPCLAYVHQLGLTVELLRRLPGPDAAAARARVLDLYAAWKAGDQRSSG